MMNYCKPEDDARANQSRTRTWCRELRECMRGTSITRQTSLALVGCPRTLQGDSKYNLAEGMRRGARRHAGLGEGVRGYVQVLSTCYLDGGRTGPRIPHATATLDLDLDLDLAHLFLRRVY